MFDWVVLRMEREAKGRHEEIMRRFDGLGATAATPAMVEAGFNVLCGSGIADGYLLAHKVLVAQIWEAMEVARRGLNNG